MHMKVRDGKVELSHDPAVGMIARKTLTKAQKQQAGSSRGAQQAEEQQQFVIALTQVGLFCRAEPLGDILKEGAGCRVVPGTADAQQFWR